MTSEEFRNNPLFLRNQFEGEGVFQIPIVKKQHVSLEQLTLIGYDHIKQEEHEHKNSMVHFFLDDYKFEVLWNDPEPRLEKLKQYRAVLTPQYSLYTEMPITMQIFNTFRNRWVGAYLQSKGITVIPTMCWGEPQSFWFCFDGLEVGSIVAVSTLGVRTEKALFMQGYQEMIRRIQPQAIICYGEPFEEMEGNVITVDYAEANRLSKWARCICGEEAVPKGSNVVIKRYGYVLSEKGMGSIGKWKPKKKEDERFLGKPGEIKTMNKKNGDKYITKIGDNGKAYCETHYSYHGNPSKHENPHEHAVEWSEGYPRLGPGHPVGGKKVHITGRKITKMEINTNNCYEDKFETVEEYLFSMINGGEIVFEYEGKEYGMFRFEDGIHIAESYHEETKIYADADAALEYKVNGKKLRDIITKVNIVTRNL